MATCRDAMQRHEYGKAFALAKALANAGDVGAMATLAGMYASGLG